MQMELRKDELEKLGRNRKNKFRKLRLHRVNAWLGDSLTPTSPQHRELALKQIQKALNQLESGDYEEVILD